MSGRPCVEDGNATACYMFLVCILPLHGIPICLFALELFFPQFFQRFEATRRLRDTQRFVWTMKRLYRSSYGDIWKAGACMWLISVWTPVGIALQLFLPGYQISNDESSMNVPKHHNSLACARARHPLSRDGHRARGGSQGNSRIYTRARTARGALMVAPTATAWDDLRALCERGIAD